MSPVSAEATTYIDAVPLLEAALAAMGPGEVVQSERVSLLDLMSAIEVLDPRTDSYTAAVDAAKELEALPAFEPAVELLPVELMWILDHLFRLEVRNPISLVKALQADDRAEKMTHMDGHPMISTLLTCQYLRPKALRRMSTARPLPSAPAGKPPEWRTIVLRSMLLATIKTQEMCWEELYKGNVYEVRA